jgi:hypothetical protein
MRTELGFGKRLVRSLLLVAGTMVSSPMGHVGMDKHWLVHSLAMSGLDM